MDEPGLIAATRHLPAVRCAGESSNPSVLFLHGFMGSSNDWTPVMRTLGARYRCVAMDLPGHGASLRMDPDCYTLSGATGALLDRIGDLGLERPTLVGYSMGGRLAMHLALRDDARFAGLVLESAHPGLETPTERAGRRTVDAERIQAIRRDFAGFVDAWYRQPLFASLADDPDRRERLVRERSLADPEELARALAGLGTGEQSPLRERLSSLRVPVLLVAGGTDAAYVDVNRDLASRIPGASSIIVEEAGHNVHLERPDQFVASLLPFLERTNPATTCP